MTLNRRAIWGLSAGGFGGVVAWTLIEKTGWFYNVLYGDQGVTPGSSAAKAQIVMGALYGLITTVAAAVTCLQASWPVERKARPIAVGIIAGAALGAFGFAYGQRAYFAFDSLNTAIGYAHGSQGGALIQGALARAASWAVIGVMVGAAQGIARWDKRSAGLAILGGLLGGITGGFFFEAVETASSNPPASRFIGFVFVAAAIGFFAQIKPKTAIEGEVRTPVRPSASKQPLAPPRSSQTQPPTQPRTLAPPALSTVVDPLVGTRLVCIEGPCKGQSYALPDRRTVSVGRGKDQQLSLSTDKTVSRQHASVKLLDGRHVVEDLGSANGTSLNGALLKSMEWATLAVGDRVRFGESTFLYE